MTEIDNEQLTRFSGFSKKNFKKVPADVLPALWQLHYHIKDTFDEPLSRILLQFYLDTQTVMSDAYGKEKKFVENSKAQLEQLNEIQKQLEKTVFTTPPSREIVLEAAKISTAQPDQSDTPAPE